MGADSDRPGAAGATVHVVQDGYVRRVEGGQHVGASIGLVLDGDTVVVVDPGFVADRTVLLETMASYGVESGAVTDVVFSHHHPDHTANAALFPRARIHDHWAVYDGDLWTPRSADRFDVSGSVRLIKTPGHTEEDVTTLVGTSDGVVAFTHAWWTADGPADDPYTPDRQVLAESRRRILAVADRIVPGHGPAFTPGADTPV